LLIGAVPYSILIAARRNGRPVPTSLALLVGAGAALGFGLKHYFLILPAFLELWLLMGQGRRWRPIRPETIAVVVIGACYAAAVLLWARGFLDTVVPLVALAYGSTGAKWIVDLFQPAVCFALLTLVLVASQWHSLREDISSDAAALLVAALGSLAIYFVQSKGWAYHALPLLGCSSLGLAALLVGMGRPPRLVALAAPALLFMPLAIEARAAIRETGHSSDIRRAVAGLQSGEAAGFILVDWSIAVEQRLQYPSRYMYLWMMQAVVRNEALGGADPRLTQLGRRIVHETVLDYRCLPPRRIIIARPPPGSGDFDPLPFFLRDPNFAALLAHYKPVERTSVEVYEMVSPVERLTAPAAHCIVRAR
jgi:hypothetical protein